MINPGAFPCTVVLCMTKVAEELIGTVCQQLRQQFVQALSYLKCCFAKEAFQCTSNLEAHHLPSYIFVISEDWFYQHGLHSGGIK